MLFANDPAPNAYEKARRSLSSGGACTTCERQAEFWLDLVRRSDTMLSNRTRRVQHVALPRLGRDGTHNDLTLLSIHPAYTPGVSRSD